MAVKKKGVFHPSLGFVGADIFTNFVFLSILSSTDMQESHSRAVKTRILA